MHKSYSVLAIALFQVVPVRFGIANPKFSAWPRFSERAAQNTRPVCVEISIVELFITQLFRDYFDFKLFLPVHNSKIGLHI